MLHSNKIALLGTVTEDWKFNHRMMDEDFYASKLEVLRDSGAPDHLVLIMSKRLFTKDTKDIKDKAVYVTGSIRTFNSCEGMNTHLKLFVFVDELEVVDSADSMIEIMDGENEVITNNWVYLKGSVCKKSDFRETPGGRQLCDVILATNRDFGKSDYIPCVFWGRNGKYVSSLPVGTLLEVKGRLQSRIYVKAGESHETYEVSATHVILVEGDNIKSLGIMY